MRGLEPLLAKQLLFHMTHWVHENHQEDPSGHSCPPQLQPRWHKDGHGLDGFWGVFSHFWKGNAKQLFFYMTHWVHGNHQEDPPGHSCPPQLQPRWNKDGHGLDGFWGVYSHFWKGSAKQLLFYMTHWVHGNHQEDPSGHSCPPQLQPRRHLNLHKLNSFFKNISNTPVNNSNNINPILCDVIRVTMV